MDIIKKISVFTCSKNKDRFKETKIILGTGGFASVYLGFDEFAGKTIAIKKIDMSVLDRISLKGCLNEPCLLNRFKLHRNIVNIYGKKIIGNYLILYLECIDGPDLISFLNTYMSIKEPNTSKVVGLPEKICCFLLKQIVETIDFLHKNNVCHRDIKLENAMLSSKDFRVVLIDFGFSREIKKGYMLNQSCGTLLYVSPEIIKENPYDGKKSDCWSLGVIMYLLLHGYNPFDSKNDYEIKFLITRAKINYNENLSFESISLMKSLLFRIPEYRFSTSDILNSEWILNNQITTNEMHSFIKDLHKEKSNLSKSECKKIRSKSI